MKKLYTLLLFLPFIASAQQNEDTKINLIPKKTDSLYWQVKYALGKCDYIVREDGNMDTLRTFAAKSPFIEGFTAIIAVIKDGKIELSGYYGLSQFDGWLFTHQPNQYKPITFFKNSKAWKQLLYIASKIDCTEITYTK
ncbi:hypothetical protein [Flavisolibacter ginsenosidimutans]|uniref:Uncharacterized protein n=1 Tax=Flavisolibacter ginsenosidimutans TaxID=661481 RepID=A0A5B8UM76_9BACT|nr:hypothetical protein [Flavisolibacter ginsenosidimutans]QEC57668.1 hypothetical protein FSB75_17755 [Flavisolibacter ginsenosidimutans]